MLQPKWVVSGGIIRRGKHFILHTSGKVYDDNHVEFTGRLLNWEFPDMLKRIVNAPLD